MNWILFACMNGIPVKDDAKVVVIHDPKFPEAVTIPHEYLGRTRPVTVTMHLKTSARIDGEERPVCYLGYYQAVVPGLYPGLEGPKELLVVNTAVPGQESTGSPESKPE